MFTLAFVSAATDCMVALIPSPDDAVPVSAFDDAEDPEAPTSLAIGRRLLRGCQVVSCNLIHLSLAQFAVVDLLGQVIEVLKVP
jgi:hypothetical protein